MLYKHIIRQALERRHYHRFAPRAALIDMDGTLYDSMPNHARAWVAMTAELGIHTTEQEIMLWEGRTGADTIGELFRRSLGREATPDEIKRHYARKTELFRQYPAPEPMPGAAEMLRALTLAGIRCVLVTGSGQNSLISRLDTDYPGVFAPDMRVTAHNVTHGKPHPEPFLKAMQIASVHPWSSIAIDNAPLGVTAGARSGAFTIGVATGGLPAQALTEAGADIVFPSMSALAQAMPALLLDMLTTTADD